MQSVGAHCGKSARWVLCGGTSTRDHAGSVRALARKRQQPRGSAKATVSRLVSTYLLDRWFEDEVKPRLKGFAAEIRSADDAILCFANREDAQRVFDVLPKRFAKFGLTLHPQKTRLIEFGRRAHAQAKRTKTKPATFNFLGFTHLMATSRKGKFVVHVRTMKKRLKRGLTAIAAWCRAHCHAPLEFQQQTLNAKLRGHFQYYGRPSNYRSLAKFVFAVRRIWRTWLSRRTRGRRLSWERFDKLLARYPLLRPRITRPWRTSESVLTNPLR